jgi:hypothetical protein
VASKSSQCRSREVEVDRLAKHARATGRVAALSARTVRTLDSIAVDGRDGAALQTLRVGGERWRGVGDRSVVARVRNCKRGGPLRVYFDRLEETAHAAFDL